MQVVIDVPNWLYNAILEHKEPIYSQSLAEAIRDGTPLPKGHGAIKDVSQIEIPMCEDRSYERWVQVAINSAPTIIEAES